MKSKLDRYVSSLDTSSKRAKDSGIKFTKRQGNSDRDFRGFKRINDQTAGTTHGHDAQRTVDANKLKSVEGGTTRSSLGTSGSSEYVKTSTSEGLSGKKGSW